MFAAIGKLLLSPARPLLAGLCLLVIAQPGHGQQWLIDGSFKTQTIYDDNLRLSPSVKDDTFGLTGGIDVKAEKDTGATQIELRGRAEGTLYSKSDSDVPDDGFVLLGIGYRHGITERSEIGLDGGFINDSTLENTADVTDDPGDIDPGITSFRVRRNKLNLAPMWTYALTERFSLDLGYDFIGVEYGSDKDKADLEDYRYQSGAGGLFYRLTETTTLSATLQAFGYSAQDSDTDYTGGSLSAGVEHRFSKTLWGDLTFGAYNTDFDVDSESSSKNGGLFGASLVKRDERTRVRALVSRDLRPSGSGQMRQADQILLAVKREITPRVDFSFRTRFLKTENIGIGSSNEREYVLIEPGVIWHLSERFDLAATYRYRSKDDRAIGDTAESNRVFLSLVYDWAGGSDFR